MRLPTSRTVVASAAAAITLLATPAFAHTTANASSTAAGSFAIVDMRVPHGCEGADTVQLDVQIPAGVVSVKPEQVTGWTVTTEIGEYAEPVNLHGSEITEGVVAVTWTADDGVSLPDSLYRDFGLSVRLPDAPDSTLYFPAVQTCIDGSTAAWIELPTDDDAELAKPAPAITLTAAATGHGHDNATDEASESATDEGHAEGETEEAASLSVVEAAAEDDGRDPLVWIAMALGFLGLAVGAAGFAASRKG